MRPRVVVVAYEAPVLIKQVRLYFVRFMERFYLANRCRPTHAGSDMLNPQFTAAPVESRYFTSRRRKLGTLISEDLLWNTKPPNSSIKKQHGVLSGWAVNLNRAGYEA